MNTRILVRATAVALAVVLGSIAWSGRSTAASYVPGQAAAGSPVTVSQNLDGRLQVFVVGSNGQLYSRWQTTENGGWSLWKALGGSLGIATESPIAVKRNRDGALQALVVAANGDTYSMWQTSANGSWTDWSSVGGSTTFTPRASIVLDRNQDGRLQAFIIGPSGKSYTMEQTAPEGSFGNWTAVAGTTGFAAGAHLTASENSDGRLQVFGVGTNGQAYSCWQTADNGAFTDWRALGGTTSFRSGAEIALGNKVDGGMQAFAVGANGQSYSTWQADPNGSFNSWSPIGGSLALPSGSPIAVGPNADGRLQAFVVGANGQSYSVWQTSANGGFVDWRALGGSATFPVRSPIATGSNQDHRLQGFAFGSSDNMLSMWQTTPNGSWTDWAQLHNPS